MSAIAARINRLEARSTAAGRCPTCGGAGGIRGVVYLDDEPEANLAPCPRCGARVLAVTFGAAPETPNDADTDPVGGAESPGRNRIDHKVDPSTPAPEIRDAISAAGRPC
ncbi:MAG: hypothetical protein ABFD84_10485 [Candidatus Polarisedimenticolia bacterium]